MSQIEEEKVSIREFARRLGVSDTAVLKAYKAGKIKKGIVYPPDGGRPYVLPIIACQEWGKNLNPDSGNNEHLIQNIENLNSKKQPPKSLKIESKKQKDISEEDIESTPNVDEGQTLTEAKRVEAVYRAKLLRLEFLQKEKELVPTREVNKQLAEAGIRIREAIESVPNKAIDNILAQPGRNEALIVFNKAIKEVLEKLALGGLEIK